MGNPTTLLYDPEIDSTKIAPKPWIEYAPALSKGSLELRYHSSRSASNFKKRTSVQTRSVI
jgi:hypothetical protein